MKKRVSNKHPLLLQHLHGDMIDEIAAWRSLLAHEWRWISALVAVFLALLALSRPLPPRDVYLAAGQPGSTFEALAQKFVPLFAREGVRLHLVTTAGSVDSLNSLADETTPINAALMVGGVIQKGAFPRLASLGSIEYAPTWLFYRGAPPKGEGVGFFADKRVAVGLPGSATEIMLQKILQLNGDSLDGRPNYLRLSNRDAAEKLARGEIDAAFIVDGIEGANVQKLLFDKNVHLYNFEFAAAYVKKLPFLNVVTLPKGALNLKDNHPAQDVQMLASTMTLLVERDMHPAIQQLFLLTADTISKDLSQFFAKPEFFPAYVDRAVALSPVAQRFYDHGPPMFRAHLPLWLASYLDRIWLVLIGAIAIAFPIFKLLPSYRNKRSIMLVADAYAEIQAIEQLAGGAGSPAELQALLDRLNELDAETRECWVASSDMNRLYTMKSAINLIRTHIGNRIKALAMTD